MGCNHANTNALKIGTDSRMQIQLRTLFVYRTSRERIAMCLFLCLFFYFILFYFIFYFLFILVRAPKVVIIEAAPRWDVLGYEH